MSLFEITGAEIGQLTNTQLPDLLRRLLNQEAAKHGINRSSVNVAGNITAPDGGVDGSIIWEGQPIATDFLPKQHLVFQSKAQSMTSTAAGVEVENRPRSGDPFIKPMVDKALSKGAGYILFSTTDLNDQQRPDAIESIRQKLRNHGKDYADTAFIGVYDRQKIASWCNSFFPIRVTVKEWIGKPVPNGFLTFEQWAALEKFEDCQLCSDESVEQIIEGIVQRINSNESLCRVKGPSGIGKSRMVYEACKKLEQIDRIIYYNDGFNPKKILDDISLLLSENNSVLIVDNCDVGLHGILANALPNTVMLITLDFNEDSSGSRELIIPEVSDDVIGQIVQSRWPDIEAENLKTIIDYAGGFPLIAVTLAKDYVEGFEDVGKLRDNDLKQKLLGAEATPQDIAAIEVLSLFDAIGFERELSGQYKYIAEKIAGISPPDFYRSIKLFERRRLIDIGGDYRRVRPLPLAIRLAADWWEDNSTDRIMEVIALIDPNNCPQRISESFCKAVARLDFVAKAVEVTDAFCGPNGPFVHAGMLESVWGSKLFCSFVEVNPKATTNALYKVSEKYSIDEIKTIFAGDIRRNLYWSFEKLCFRKSVFEKAALILLRFAAAENESWGNNCTGLVKQLFSPYLSGTESEPEQRLSVINRGLSIGDERIDSIIIDALEQAVHDGHRTRTLGSERQGLNQELKEWQAKTWGELFKYQDDSLELLGDIALNHPTLSSKACKAITSSLRGMIRRPDHKVLYGTIDRLIEKYSDNWPDALNAIRNIRVYELDHMGSDFKKEIGQILDKWENELTPNTIETKIKQIVDVPSWDHLKEEDGNIVDLSEGRAVDFAREVVAELPELVKYTDGLVVGELRKGYLFARELATHNKDHECFLNAMLDSLSKSDPKKANSICVGAYLVALRGEDIELYNHFINRIYQENSLNRFYVDCVRLQGIEAEHVDNIISLLVSDKIEPHVLKSLAYGSVTENLDPQDVVRLTDSILNKNIRFGWISLEVLYMYVHGSKEKWQDCELALIKMIETLDFDEQGSLHTMNMHHWEQVCEKLIEKNDEHINKVIIDKVFLVADAENALSTADHSIHVVIDKLITNGSYDLVLDKLTEILSEGDLLKNIKVECLVAGPSVSDGSSHLLDIPEEVLLAWADDNLDFGPEYIAKSSPLYVNVEGENICHPLALKIVDKYGDNEKVLYNLSSFAGVKSCSGSRLPDMQGERDAYEQLSNHEKHSVRAWALEYLDYANKVIEAETRREGARDFGIY